MHARAKLPIGLVESTQMGGEVKGRAIVPHVAGPLVLNAALARPAFLTVLITHGPRPAGFDLNQDLFADEIAQTKGQVVTGAVDARPPGGLDLLIPQVRGKVAIAHPGHHLVAPVPDGKHAVAAIPADVIHPA